MFKRVPKETKRKILEKVKGGISCAQAEEKCHYEYEAEDAKIVCNDPYLD